MIKVDIDSIVPITKIVPQNHCNSRNFIITQLFIILHYLNYFIYKYKLHYI